MSIRIRLGLWYGAIFAVALVIFGAALYWLMANHLENMLQDSIEGRAGHLGSALAATVLLDTGAGGLPALDVFESSEVYVQVLDADGNVVGRSSNLEGRSLPSSGAADAPLEGRVSLDGVALKQVSRPVIVDGRTVAWVQVAGSYRQRDMVLSRLRWGLLGGGLAIVTLVGVAGGALAGRALSPISEMTETARAIALSRGFSRRLRAGRPGDELGQLARTFNDMLASLEEAYSAQQRFTADASHELRAPLTAIQGNLDLLARVADMPEEERAHALSEVHREVGRLSRLVNDLLGLARADAGQPLRAEPVELDAILVEVHREARSIANGVSIRIDTIEPVVVNGEPDRLKELLLILADNAIKYTPEGGAVTLGIRREPPWVAVRVDDTGIGIDPADLPHVFERFWRADRARSRDSGGTGLGLAIARWIVERHGGEISLEPREGGGTRVEVRFLAAS